ncbi:ABC transporter substrate-binding protein [Streptomyces sp. NBC_01304]|uniref:ABC transporter substrate-binding protein n=1 Tax=Streptomyces sp. NBC_01304 TaxID=2903818 RepID=UPI002E121A5F|nr:ABC transporter substrate-binding protein [Streptomyces sp. NBC_01304]
MRGSVLDGRYTLAERIGAGGMGEVWRAEDARLQRRVAVKVLSMPPGTSAAEGQRLLAMFGREARAAAALDSSYIVPVFDHGTADGVPYLVMPLLSGRTVRDLLLESGPPPLERVAAIGAQVCRALVTAHRAGIVHRDIKPANVMVTDEDTVKVLDFGIAKFLDATAGAGYLTGTSDAPVGTLHYMAPERFTRGPDDGRSDVYSLGCMVHQLLTGQPPFDPGSAASLMHCHVYEMPEAPSVRRPGLPPAWDELVVRMLAKQPGDRPDAQEALDAFEALGGARAQAGNPAPAPPPPADADSYPFAPQPSLPPMPQAPPPAAASAPAPASPAPFTPAASPAVPAYAPTSLDMGSSGPAPPRRRSRAKAWWVSAGAAVAVGALVATLVVFNPFKKEEPGGGSGGGGNNTSEQDNSGGGVSPVASSMFLSLGSAADSKGPAPAVKGARKGGTVSVLEPNPISTIDPGQMWPGTDQQIADLLYRRLTAFKSDPTGYVKLVGDLATDTGQSSDGRAWTFKLKPRLTYSDGTPVRAKDFRYAIERTTKPGLSSGDRTVRSFLYGPKAGESESGKPPKAGAIETPDDRTLVFHLADVHWDFNVALASPSAAPLPEGSADTASSALAATGLPGTGPYKAGGFTNGKSLTLTRNPQWQKSTDPVRTAYPDGYTVEAGVQLQELRARITVAAGEGKAVATFNGSDDPLLTAGQAGAKDATLKSVKSPTWYVQSYMINIDRVKNVKARQAIAIALPADDIRKASGGNGTVTHRLMPPGVVGADQRDIYGAGRNGDPTEARKYLIEAGQTDLRLTLGVRDTSVADTQRAEAVQAGLKKAGIDVTIKKVSATEFWDGVRDGKFDLYRVSVGSGLPTASTYLPDYFDGRQPGYPVSSNYNHFSNEKVNQRIDIANDVEDISDAGRQWSYVDELVMAEAVAIPAYVPTLTYLHSTKLKGLQVSMTGLSPLNAYVAR